jgi:hypothetical protein
MVQAGFTAGHADGDVDRRLAEEQPCLRKGHHPGGEDANSFTRDGNVPLTLASNPRKDRHIAQRNLAPFDMTLMAIKKPAWTKFIVAQAGAGVNALRLEHGLPLDAVRVYLAIPRPAYERYIDPQKSKGGAVRGFEPAHDGRGRSPLFPDAVTPQRTQAAAGSTSPTTPRSAFSAWRSASPAIRRGSGTCGRATCRWCMPSMTVASSAASRSRCRRCARGRRAKASGGGGLAGRSAGA